MTKPESGLYIPSLDGLRCIAILLVFLSHVQMAAGVPRFIPGNFGVTLFFFLSGYLITTLMRLEIERHGRLDVRRFYIRRALRIFPTCYVVLGAAALYGWAVGRVDPMFLLGQALHLTNYLIIANDWNAPIAPNTDVYWSLAVEEHFYLAFPAVLLLLWRGRTRQAIAATLLVACGLVLAWRLTLIHGLGASFDRTYLGTDTRIDSILFGCVLALWGNPVLDPTRYQERTWKWVFLPLALAVLLSSFLLSREMRETVGYTVQGLALFAVFVTAVRYPQWVVMRPLQWAPVRWIGLLSYAIYLVHPSMLEFAKFLVGKSAWPLLFVASALTLAAACLLFYAIERPVGRLRRRFAPVPATGAPGTKA